MNKIVRTMVFWVQFSQEKAKIHPKFVWKYFSVFLSHIQGHWNFSCTAIENTLYSSKKTPITKMLIKVSRKTHHGPYIHFLHLLLYLFVLQSVRRDVYQDGVLSFCKNNREKEGAPVSLRDCNLKKIRSVEKQWFTWNL